jgi:hypothetical protein
MMKWAGHVLLMGEMRNACTFLVGNSKGSLGNLGVELNCMSLVELDIYVSARANRKFTFMNNELPPKVWLEVLQHPPYSPNLAPSDCRLLGPLK